MLTLDKTPVAQMSTADLLAQATILEYRLEDTEGSCWEAMRLAHVREELKFARKAI